MGHSARDDAYSRRELLKSAVYTASGLTASGLFTPLIAEHAGAFNAPDNPPSADSTFKSMKGVPFERHTKVRFGIVGTGLRGRSVMNELLSVQGAEIVAICDPNLANASRAAKLCKDHGHKEPVIYSEGPEAFEKLVIRDDIDFVYTATPWEWHVPVMLASLSAGKHCGSECPLGTTLKDLWALVNASEKARKHCMQLENCNYGETEMLINRMVKEGIFGEVLHVEGAYLHDLRDILFEDKDEGLWRRAWHTRLNGNLYPTHGLGPITAYVNVHFGDRFDYLISMSSPQRGLDLYREKNIPDKKDPKWKEVYVTGDHNTTLMKTINGKTVLLQHDVSSPRPYTRHHRLQGTLGAFEDYPPRIYIDGQTGGERWATVETWKKQFSHPLWSEIGERAKSKGGHGGMDFIMAYRLVQTMLEGQVPDIDIYDSAIWSAPLPLSEISIARNSSPVKFPDFTRGKYK